MGKCEFCKLERPLILCSEYQICYNCMMRLKDAAPKLLEALESIMMQDGLCLHIDRRRLKQARIVIAKAKGESKNESV